MRPTTPFSAWRAISSRARRSADQEILRPITARPAGSPAATSRTDPGPAAADHADRPREPRCGRVVWPTVPANHPDEAALDVLASILGGESRWNRLFRALTYDRQIATQVSAYHPTYLLAGTFDVYLVARFGQKLDELVRLADAEIERAQKRRPHRRRSPPSQDRAEKTAKHRARFGDQQGQSPQRTTRPHTGTHWRIDRYWTRSSR